MRIKVSFTDESTGEEVVFEGDYHSDVMAQVDEYFGVSDAE